MFERYTEKARRVIFFARYESSLMGSMEIAPEHLLLGLLREGGSAIIGYLQVDAVDLAERLHRREKRGQVATSVDVPLDDASRRVLERAAAEASAMGHTWIGTEHLLLGVMREERGFVVETLRAMGAPSMDEVRNAVAASQKTGEQRTSQVAKAPSLLPLMRVVDEAGRELIAERVVYSVPRIGEAVLCELNEEGSVRHTVLDVQWKYPREVAGGTAAAILAEIRVRRERSV